MKDLTARHEARGNMPPLTAATDGPEQLGVALLAGGDLRAGRQHLPSCQQAGRQECAFRGVSKKSSCQRGCLPRLDTCGWARGVRAGPLLGLRLPLCMCSPSHILYTSQRSLQTRPPTTVPSASTSCASKMLSHTAP